jgi:hypothetical protein
VLISLKNRELKKHDLMSFYGAIALGIISCSSIKILQQLVTI